MVVHRRRTQQSRPLKERLAEFADRLRRKAREIPIGPEKDEIKKKLRQVSVAAEWASSAELRPPSDHRRPRRP